MEELFTRSNALLSDAEGLRLRMYKDTTGHWTIGYGHNLEAKGISKKIAKLILEEDVNDTISECKEKIPFFSQLDVPRQYVLVNMAFNMGIGGLLSFVRMLNALNNRDYPEAAKELENSLANRQVPNRIYPLIKILESGKFPDKN